MTDVIAGNWLAFAVALAIGLAVVWWLWGRSAKGPERHHAPDALDAATPPARRNQALIDAPREFGGREFGGSASGNSAVSQKTAAAAATGPAIFGGIGEVVAAAAASEVNAASPPAVPQAPGDDLIKLKGVGPKLAARLRELGITRFAQIAAWTAADIAAIDAELGTFAGRATRDNWVEQAGFLAKGDVAGYEARFGKL